MKTKFSNSPLIRIPGILIMLITICVSCSEKNDESKAEIVADLKNSKTSIEGKMLYLGNTETRNFIDSCIVKDGKFKFSVKVDTNFSPIPANIVYSTSDPKLPYRLVGFKNPVLKKTFDSEFFIDRGTMFAEMDSSYILRNNEICLLFKNINRQTLAACRHLAFSPNSPYDKKKS